MKESRSSLSVHRCRFVDFVPSAVTALAFPPLPLHSSSRSVSRSDASSSKKTRFGTLAIGRANGNVELYEWSGSDHDVQSSQAWVPWKVIPGPIGSKVESLAFTIQNPDFMEPNSVPQVSDLRLFSSGGGSELIEWDMEQGCVMRTISSQGGAIWCMAANPSNTRLALGCEDGTIRLLNIEDNSLEHLRRLDKAKCRILSIVWGPPTLRHKENKTRRNSPDDEDEDEDDEAEWVDNWIVTGGSDSALRKWDVSSGRVLDKMSVDRVRGERTLVWTVGILGDGTIVSGDSLGTVKFWDSKTCTQLETFEAHGADVLCLAIGTDGNSVFTSGVDQKVCQFTYLKASKQDKPFPSISISQPLNKWIRNSSKRMHSHDVRALAIWPPYSPLPPALSSHRPKMDNSISPILASGGLDMSVVLAPCASAQQQNAANLVNPLSTSSISTFEDAYHRRMSYSTGISPAIQIARTAQLLLCRRDAGVSVWRILKKGGNMSSMDVDELLAESSKDNTGYKRVLDMDFKTQTSLISSAISDDGSWLAVSDLYETKLFALETVNGDLRPRRIKEFTPFLIQHLPENEKSALLSTGSSALGFSPDSRKLVLGLAFGSSVCIIELGRDGQSLQFIRKLNHHRSSRDAMLKLVREQQQNDDGDAMDVVEEAETQNEDYAMLLQRPKQPMVARLAFSPDGQWLATSDDDYQTHVFNLDTAQHHCLVPSKSRPVLALSFSSSPSSPSLLLLAFSNHQIDLYDVESRQFPDWSRELCTSLPQRFTQLHDPVLGMMFNPPHPASPATAGANDTAQGGSGGNRDVYFWGSTWLCKVTLDAPVGWGGFTRKRRRAGADDHSSATPAALRKKHQGRGGHGQGGDGEDTEQINFKIVTKYRPVLFADFLSTDELVVVERPLVDVLATLPPAFFKVKYGT